MVIKHIKIGDPINDVGMKIDQTKCVVAFTKELISKGGLPLFGMYRSNAAETLRADNLVGKIIAIDWKHGTVAVKLYLDMEITDSVRVYKAYNFTTDKQGNPTEVTGVYGFYFGLVNQPEPISAHT